MLGKAENACNPADLEEVSDMYTKGMYVCSSTDDGGKKKKNYMLVNRKVDKLQHIHAL